jgi:hypothetical protein
MLRLALLVLYLIASFSPSLQTSSGGWNPWGLNSPPPQTDGGGGADPLG